VYTANCATGTTFNGQAPLQRQFRLGGFLDLSGLNPDELIGQNSGIAQE
jgi:hypothetical protein